MAAKRKAIGANINHTSSALTQALDSKDKIATRLQPATRVIILFGPLRVASIVAIGACGEARRRRLGSKGLAIMNFL